MIRIDDDSNSHIFNLEDVRQVSTKGVNYYDNYEYYLNIYIHFKTEESIILYYKRDDMDVLEKIKEDVLSQFIFK